MITGPAGKLTANQKFKLLLPVIMFRASKWSVAVVNQTTINIPPLNDAISIHYKPEPHKQPKSLIS